MKIKREIWLTLYGVFLALLIQTIYDAIGPQPLKSVVGLGVSALGLWSLLFFAFKKETGRNDENKEPEQIKLLKEISAKLDKIIDSKNKL